MNERILQIVIQPNPNNCSATIRTTLQTAYVHGETLDEIFEKIREFYKKIGISYL